MRCGLPSRSPSGRPRRAIASASFAHCSRSKSAASTSSRRARPTAWPHSLRRRCRSSKPPTMIWRFSRPTVRSGMWRTCVGGRTRDWMRPSARSSTCAGRGSPHFEDELVYTLAWAQLNGTTPVSKFCEWLDEQQERWPQNALLREARGWRSRCSAVSTRRA